MDGDEWQELTNHDTTAPVNWNGETEVGLDEKVALLLWTTRRSNCYGYHITETLVQREAKLGNKLQLLIFVNNSSVLTLMLHYN